MASDGALHVERGRPGGVALCQSNANEARDVGREVRDPVASRGRKGLPPPRSRREYQRILELGEQCMLKYTNALSLQTIIGDTGRPGRCDFLFPGSACRSDGR